MAQKKPNKRVSQPAPATNGDKPANAYFLSLELENVRCFSERQKIDFSDGNGKHRQWTIILGDNGTGKTTILQSLVLMFPQEDLFYDDELGTEDITSMPLCYKLPYGDLDVFRDPRLHTSITAKLKAQPTFQNTSKEEPSIIGVANHFQFLEKDFSAYYSPGNSWCSYTFCNPIYQKGVAYGALRKAGETSLSEQSEDSAYNTIFDEKAFLLNPEEWLLQAHYATTRKSESQEKRKKELEQVKDILKKVLPDVDDIRFSEKDTGKRIPQPIVEFHTPYGWVEAKDLSLGYRTSMAWVVDFASRMFDTYQESENPLAEPAVCLVDEIDLHLHPRWQREMIDYLTNLFPNTQFIVTTHSPLIVQAAAARDANFVVCKREGDHVVIDQSIEAVRGWRTDQLLTSDLFGLESSRDVDIERLEKEQRRILSKAKLTKADEKRAREIAAELNSLRVMENPEDDKAMEIIRDAARYLQNNGRK